MKHYSLQEIENEFRSQRNARINDVSMFEKQFRCRLCKKYRYERYRSIEKMHYCLWCQGELGEVL